MQVRGTFSLLARAVSCVGGTTGGLWSRWHNGLMWAAMARHRFDLGQTVIALAPGIPPGPYVIIRHLPVVGTEPHYHAKDDNGIVRALLESQTREFMLGTQSAARPPQIGARVRRASN